MSMALLAKVDRIEKELAESLLSIDALRRETQRALEAMGAIDAERRELRKEVRELRERVATFDALKDAVAKDAREILGSVRDRIDPTKVKMPHPLKALGYAVPR